MENPMELEKDEERMLDPKVLHGTQSSLDRHRLSAGNFQSEMYHNYNYELLLYLSSKLCSLKN